LDFDFVPLADLDLNAFEMKAVNEIYAKQKVNQAYWQETPQVFIENYIRCSKSAIPCNAIPSVVIAQGILESGWFSTNSLFGVKASVLQTQEHIGVQSQTHEVVGTLSIPTVGTFYESPGVQNNFANYYAYILRMKTNSAQFMPSDYIGFLNYLQSPLAYSTAGADYVNSITEVIRSNNLTVFDHA